MKDKIYLLLFLSFFSCKESDVNPIIDLTKYELKGQIKTCKYFFYLAEPIYEPDVDEYDGNPKIIGYKKGEIAGTDTYTSFKIYFNINGYEIGKESYHTNNLQGKKEYTLDSKMRVSKIRNYRFINNKYVENKLVKYEYDYDSNNRVIEKSFSNEKKSKWNNYYKYNNQNNIVETYFEMEKGIPINKTFFEYDLNEKPIKRVLYTGKDNKDTITTQFDYNNKGLKSQEKTFTSRNDKAKIKKYSYKYDLNSNWIERRTIENNMEKIITERIIEYY